MTWRPADCTVLAEWGRASVGRPRWGGEGRVLTRLFTEVDSCNTSPGTEGEVVFAPGY